MTAIARMAMLDLRTVAPYRRQGLVLFGLVVLLFADKSAVALVPALVLLVTSQIAAYPFLVADKAGLETLYAVLPLPRRSVLYGHYAWAIASFLVTATVGTALALVLARAEAVPFGESHARDGADVVLGVVRRQRRDPVPLVYPVRVLPHQRPRHHPAVGGDHAGRRSAAPDLTSVETWVPLLWPAGVAAIVISATVAMTVDGRRRLAARS